MTTPQIQTEPLASSSWAKPQLVAIPASSIMGLWPLLEPMLRPAGPLSDWRITAESELLAASRGELQVFVIKRFDKSAQAVVVTEIVDYANRKACRVLQCFGEGLHEWKHLLRQLEGWARSEGCDLMEIHGREGWGRVYRDYRKLQTVFTKDLDDGQ